jgi:hypothetical protein
VSGERRLRRSATLLLLVAALALGIRLYRARFYLDFLDEAAETTAAWLASEGETLYGSVFSHRMLLPPRSPTAIDRFVKERYPRVRPEEFEGLLWERRATRPLLGIR